MAHILLSCLARDAYHILHTANSFVTWTLFLLSICHTFKSMPIVCCTFESMQTTSCILHELKCSHLGWFDTKVFNLIKHITPSTNITWGLHFFISNWFGFLFLYSYLCYIFRLTHVYKYNIGVRLWSCHSTWHISYSCYHN